MNIETTETPKNRSQNSRRTPHSYEDGESSKKNVTYSSVPKKTSDMSSISGGSVLSWRDVLEVKSARSDDSVRSGGGLRSDGSARSSGSVNAPKLIRDVPVMPVKGPHILELPAAQPGPTGTHNRSVRSVSDFPSRATTSFNLDQEEEMLEFQNLMMFSSASSSRLLSVTTENLRAFESMINGDYNIKSVDPLEQPAPRERLTKSSTVHARRKGDMGAGPKGLQKTQTVVKRRPRTENQRSPGVFLEGDRVEVQCTVTQTTRPTERIQWKPGFVLSDIPKGACSRGEKVRYLVVFDDGQRGVFGHWQMREKAMSMEGFCAAAGLGLLKVVQGWVRQSNGLQVSARDGSGLSALQRACISGTWEVVHYLVEEAHCFVHSKLNGFTAFELAFLHGNLPVMQYIVRHRISSTKSSRLMNGSVGTLHMRIKESRFSHALDSVEARSLCEHFVHTTNPCREDIDLSNVFLIHRNVLIEKQRFLSFEKYISVHVRAKDITDQESVLFLCHRWETSYDPDPDGRQFALVQNFLEETEQGQLIQYVWIDYCCLPNTYHEALSVGSSISTLKRNVSTITVLSSHCLVVPSTIYEESDFNGVTIGSSITDLTSFSTRAWLQVEIVCCLLSCCHIYVAYSFGNLIKRFVEVSLPYWYDDENEELSGGRVYGGLEIGGLYASRGLSRNSQCDFWHGLLAKYWGVEEINDPTLSLERLYKAVAEMMKNKQLLGRIVTCSLTKNDIRTNEPLAELATNLGGISVEEERIEAVQLLVFMLLYSIGKFPSKEEIRESGGLGCAQS